MIRYFSKWAAHCAPLVLALSACMADTGPATDMELGAESEALTEVAPAREIVPFEDPAGVGGAARVENHVLLRNTLEYQKFFGHEEPLDQVRFDRGDVVVFFSAGQEPTGGYTASFTGLDFIWGRWLVGTKLEVPGAGCNVIQQVSYPYALGVIRQAYYPRLAFKATQVSEVDCPPMCGGIAGFPCPGAGVCVDDRTDDCDPAKGGADCSGVCLCKRELTCAEGEEWNGSADVCACEPKNPCALTLCPPHTQCTEVDGTAVCRPQFPDPCRSHPCPVGFRCIAPADAPICVR